MSMTQKEIEDRIINLEKAVTDLSSIMNNMLPKIQMKQFSLFVETTLTNIADTLDSLQSAVDELRSKHQ